MKYQSIYLTKIAHKSKEIQGNGETHHIHRLKNWTEQRCQFFSNSSIELTQFQSKSQEDYFYKYRQADSETYMVKQNMRIAKIFEKIFFK